MTDLESTHKKKILFLITKSNWGGAQRYVFDLATSLPRDRYDVVVAFGGDGALEEKLREVNVRTIAIPGLQRDVSLVKEIRSSLAMYKIIHQEKPDILHLNSSKAGAVGALIGRIARVPKIIFTAHGWAFNEDRSYISKLFIGIIHWSTVMLAHQTIAVSNGMKLQLQGPWVQEKMIVVHPGRTITHMKNRKESRAEMIDFAPKLPDTAQDIWLGTIAELHPIKRLHRAIDAMAVLTRDFPTLRFVIIHDGELRQKLEQQVKDLGLEKHVFFTGVIMEAARLLPAFDCFVLPSKSESFGYVLVEAGHAELPVVATRTGGITDLITNNENGLLVPVDDTPALTDALRTILANTALASQLAKNHAQRMLKLTVAKMTEETIVVYEGNNSRTL